MSSDDKKESELYNEYDEHFLDNFVIPHSVEIEFQVNLLISLFDHALHVRFSLSKERFVLIPFIQSALLRLAQ